MSVVVPHSFSDIVILALPMSHCGIMRYIKRGGEVITYGNGFSRIAVHARKVRKFTAA
jgi:hypothetical protein